MEKNIHFCSENGQVVNCPKSRLIIGFTTHFLQCWVDLLDTWGHGDIWSSRETFGQWRLATERQARPLLTPNEIFYQKSDGKDPKTYETSMIYDSVSSSIIIYHCLSSSITVDHDWNHCFSDVYQLLISCHWPCYLLVLTNIANWKMAMEIVDFPINSMVDFPWFCECLPEDNHF